MHITPTFSKPVTDEEKAENARLLEVAAAKRKMALDAEEAATAKANGATVSLSEASLSALTSDDQRIRLNIQWGIVRGMFLYTLFMVPVAFVAALIISALKLR